MIPEISAILEMFKAGQCTMTQALGWINQHMENADLRDNFAGLALAAFFSDGEGHGRFKEASEWSYEMADAMLKARAS